MVQLIYHEAVTNAPQWNASFCYPEGFIRWWAQPSQAGNFQLTMTTWNVQFISGIADNFLRQVMVGKEKHVQQVLQWYAETIGFWDGTTLVTWTANIQGWTLTHSMFESSDKMETVETFKPAYDASCKFIGLDHEAIFYDPETFVALFAQAIASSAARPRTIRTAGTPISNASTTSRTLTAGRRNYLHPTRITSITTVGPRRRTGRSISKRTGRKMTRTFCRNRSWTYLSRQVLKCRMSNVERPISNVQ
jgi:hypothetical protein